MNVLRLLMLQHDRVEGLLVDLAQSGAGEARELALETMARGLERHFELEESRFYSAIAPRLVLVTAERFLGEHAQIRELLRGLSAEPHGPMFAEQLEALHDAVVQHVGDEEIDLFPEVKRRFGVDELDAIGEEIERLVEGEVPPPAGDEPLSPET